MAAATQSRIDGAEVHTLWPRPDMDVLLGGRRPAVPMPADLFGPAWPLLLDLAEGAGCPVDYPGISILAACSSLIGGKRRVRPFAEGNWSEPSILWVVGVGDPSSCKSPGLEAATGPLRTLEREHAVDHADTLRQWQTECERAKLECSAWQENMKAAMAEGRSSPPKPAKAMEPDKPQRRRLLVMDTTPESLAPILTGNPEGTLSYRDELSGWIIGFERYAVGGREFWLEAYGGRPFTVDRKGSSANGPLEIPFTGVSVCGGIQPEKLAQCLLGGADDGLAARFLWAWPDAIPFRRPRRLADTDLLGRAYARLDGLAWGIGENGDQVAVTLPLAPDAADAFEAWAQANDAGVEGKGGLYKGFCGKLRGGVLRLALAGEYIRYAFGAGSEPAMVSLASLEAACDFAEEYAKPMALRVYGDASLPLPERNAALLARHIVRHRLPGINARDLGRSPHKSELPSLREADARDAAIAVLLDADWLREAGTREGGGTGRKSKDYLVNPAVLEPTHG